MPHPTLASSAACLSGRLARTLGAASLAGLAVAAVDARIAQHVADGTHAPSLVTLLLADVGVVAPLALIVGVAVTAGDLVLAPGEARSPRAWLRLLGATDARRRLVAALAPVGGLALGLWATGVAQASRTILARSLAPRVAGAALTGAALGLVVVAGTLALVVAGALRRRAADRAPGAPAISLALGGLLAAAPVAFGALHGGPGGDGGVFDVWGVLTRAELDLRAVGLLGALALGAWVAQHAFARLGRGAVPVALLFALAPLALTRRDATALGADPRVAAAIERGAPLGKVALGALRRATDRDRDGASRAFGGGDCDDRDPAHSPTAIDVPGNGIDEDCSGADAPLPAARPAPPVARAAVAAPRDWNVLLVTIDTLRADLGFSGYARPVSPNLDALAARSVVFDRAYALASYTGKSIGPMLAGKYPSETHRNWGHFNTFGKQDVMVAERLRRAGVRTLGVQAHWYFAAFSGIARGFDVWDMSAQPGGGLQPDNDLSVTGERLTASALKVLGNADNTAGRFFAWVHYLDPHADYLRHPGSPDFGGGSRAPYDAEVWYDDQQIGRLLEFVARQPWASRTVVIVTSDHGEAFGEHHMIRHGFELWEELVHVPLLVWAPGIVPHHVAARRSAIDLVPTILDALGVEPPPGDAKSDFISGQSLLDDVVAPPGHEPAARDLFVDMPAGPNNDERRAFYRGDLKLYVSGGVRYQLFDLARDPDERDDRFDDKELVAKILPAYRAFKAGLREVYVKPIPKEEAASP